MGRNQAYCKTIAVTIPNNTAASTTIPYSGYRSGILVIPGTFTGASVSFKVSQDGVTFNALYNDSNTLISITVGTDRAYRFPVEALGASYLQIVSASNEGAARTILVTLKS